MAHETVSQTALFPFCKDVLMDSLKPMHYKELTIEALKRMDIPENSVNMFRQIEDVREQFAKRDGVEYIPDPYCMFYLSSWVSDRLLLNSSPAIVVTPHISDSLKACYEGILRSPFMQNKYGKSVERHAHYMARGLLIQEHVTGWFTRHWPTLILPADNQNQWAKPCPHDFKVRTPNKIYLVDVAGDSIVDHTFRLSPGKKATDIHICANIDDNQDAIIIQGYESGIEFSTKVLTSWTVQPIQKIAFYLNVIQQGLDYSLFQKRNSG